MKANLCVFRALLGAQAVLLAAIVGNAAEPKAGREPYGEVVAKTAGMVGDAEAQRLAAAHNLQVMNLTWEDTGRFHGSAVGPNISDMTIQVQSDAPNGGKMLTCMPVIRFPNFEDLSADIDPAKFFLLVGNQNGKPLEKVSLRDFLGDVRKYLTKPESWKGDRTNLLANRDSHVLVSAQACFLPVPKEGKAEFNPVLFNYQSTAGDPAVLTILASREGTSVTIIDNQRDRFEAAGAAWGQRLFFNQKGERASLTGQRLSDFQSGQTTTKVTPATTEAAGQKGLNMVLLIQVPLKQKNPMRNDAPFAADLEMKEMAAGPLPRNAKSDVEAAVIGHGKVEGPYTEFANLDVERDWRFPVRVTVQFYKATSNGVVSDADLAEIAGQIKKVYDQADYVGSLVVDGTTGRPTEYDGNKVQPAEWWSEFWQRYEKDTGRSREKALEEVRQAKGADWYPVTEKGLLEEVKRLPHSSVAPSAPVAPISQGWAWPAMGMLAGLAGLEHLRRRFKWRG